jgi:hypothetical protein
VDGARDAARLVEHEPFRALIAYPRRRWLAASPMRLYRFAPYVDARSSGTCVSPRRGHRRGSRWRCFPQ